MPRYVRRDGKKVEVHRTDLTRNTVLNKPKFDSVQDELVAYFYQQKTDPKAKAPKVSDIEIEADFNASDRDLAWSQYTLEIEVAAQGET